MEFLSELKRRNVLRMAVLALENMSADLEQEYFTMRGRRGETAMKHYRDALAANPHYGDALNWLWISLEGLGRYKEADALIEQARAVDPLYRVVLFN